MNSVLEALSRIEMSWYDDMYSDRDDNLTYEDDIETIRKYLVIDGCPIDVLVKALKDGIYIENIYGEMTNFKCRLTYKNEELGWYFNIINGYVMIKDYKKTWWLRKNKEE